MIPENITLNKVECFKTSDGQLFEDSNKALLHEKGILFNKELKELVNSTATIYEDAIVIFITEYKDELKQILNI